MNDWNRNGKYDAADSYIDYKGANSCGSSAVSADWWVLPLLAIVVGVCPVIGVILLICAFIFD